MGSTEMAACQVAATAEAGNLVEEGTLAVDMGMEASLASLGATATGMEAVGIATATAAGFRPV